MPQLDSLRAIAVLFVLYTHYLPSPYWPFGVYWGDIGVRCFFVLSGFLITSILLRDFKDTPRFTAAWIAFLYRRFVRLMPLLATSLVAAYALNIEPVRETFLWHISYLTNIYLVKMDAWQDTVGHLWSLAVEEQFYLLWPIFIYVVPRRYLPAATLCLAALGPLFRWYWRASGWGDIGARVLPLGSLDALGAGALLALCPTNKGTGRRTLTLVGVIGAVLWLVFQGSFEQSHDWSINTLDLSFVGLALFFAWVVGEASMGFRGPVGSLLNNPLLRYIGKISYGIYVLHTFVATYFSLWRSRSALAISVASAAVTILLAVISWHFLEQPLRAMGRQGGPFLRKASSTDGPGGKP